jgi:hypothetical protein
VLILSFEFQQTPASSTPASSTTSNPGSTPLSTPQQSPFDMFGGLGGMGMGEMDSGTTKKINISKF